MTRTTRFTPTTSIGTSSSDENGFEGPQDIADLAAIETDIGGGRGGLPRQPTGGDIPRRSPMGGIDLGKGLDLEKPRAPRSGVGLELGKSPAGNLGIGVEVPLPVTAPISARGGVSIDPATGGIRGGYGGLGFGLGPIGTSIDVGVDTPPESDKAGCFKYVTVTLGPFSHTFGKNECEPRKPIAQPDPPGNSTDFPLNWEIPRWPVGSADKYCTYILGVKHRRASIWGDTIYDEYEYEGDGDYTPEINGESETLTVKLTFIKRPGGLPSNNPRISPNVSPFWGGGGSFDYFNQVWSQTEAGYINYVVYGYSGRENVLNEYLNRPGNGLVSFYVASPIYNQWNTTYKVIYSSCGLPENIPSKNFPDPNNPSELSDSLPNSPPTKKKMDDCCKKSFLLQIEILRLLGRELGPQGLVPQTKKAGFIGEELERVETPIENPSNPKKIKVRFTTIYELLMYMVDQANNLDTALDPQSYKVPTGKLQNPEYSRDSEQSLKSNSQPNKDKLGNKRELEINKDDAAKMSGFLQQQSYMFQMLRRFEYLFPPGELQDALIAKSLLIPGAEGDIKIHNMIMAYEIQMQYLDAALGNPREILTIKDANPAIEGDQPIEVRSLSISDLLRQNIKFHIDTGGDVDALVNLVLRDFRTNLAIRIDQIKTAEMVQALFEDSGMLEKQEYIKVHLEGDPYAGQWIKGQGFKANPDLEKKTEEATEKVLRETMKPSETKIKVSRRSKDEKTDMRDLLRGLADFVQRLLSIPSSGDAANSINKLVESAKFKVQTEMALIRQNVAQAATASRNRTKKRKK
ncbi:hypothetical protein [Microcoleus sp. herbarium12]|uniref:hypothetical protein n=1 Tax=Microcoleus sp. herbarium12 TaxID=3055437 RepID=UPI002FD400C2